MTRAAPRQSSEVTVVRHLSRIAFISLATICAGGEAGAQLAGKEVHIGIGGPLTTGAASFGVEMRQAVQLAVDERNATGGILRPKIVADADDEAAGTHQSEAPAKRVSAYP